MPGHLRVDLPMTDAHRALAEAALGMAWLWALRRGRARPDLADEYLSCALFELCRAAQDWESPRGLQFTTFLASRLRGAYSRVHVGRQPAGYKNSESRDGCPRTVPISALERGGDPFNPAAPAPDGGEIFGAAALADALAIIDLLPEAQRAAIRLTMVDGLTLREAGRRLGRTAAGVKWAQVRGLARARAMAGTDESARANGPSGGGKS